MHRRGPPLPALITAGRNSACRTQAFTSVHQALWIAKLSARRVRSPLTRSS